MNKKFDYTFIALGAGVQSTALLAMSILGIKDCPRADGAIFADTGDEPVWVYSHLEILKAWAKQHNFSIYCVDNGWIYGDLLELKEGKRKRVASIPVWTKHEHKYCSCSECSADGLPSTGIRYGKLWRQCTKEYKIDPINRKIRELIGMKPKEVVKKKVGLMFGISLDEIIRAKDSKLSWITNLYPLLDARLRREDCIKLIKDADLPVPNKSACVFCPYHSDRYWRNLKNNHPQEFKQAVRMDGLVRDMSKAGVKSEAYLHRSCKPLDQIDFEPDKTQLNLFEGECEEGYCGI